MELETVPDVPVSFAKRAFSNGWQSAILTIATYGHRWTVKYFNDKMRYSKERSREFSPKTASYWSGYRAALENYTEATDDAG